MKISEAIEEVNGLKANMYTDEDKLKWLNRLDMRIKQEIIDTHEGSEEYADFQPYTADDMDKELLVGEPYAEMYIHWLEAQIDYNNMEYDSFNSSNTMFESVYSSFRNAYNASHMPIGKKNKYF